MSNIQELLTLPIEPQYLANINMTVLNMWCQLIEQSNLKEHHWLQHFDISLGLERNVDLLLLSAMMPDVQTFEKQSNHIPVVENITILAKLMKNGIDLTDPKILKELDILELQTIFPSTKNQELAKEIAQTFHEWIHYKKQYSTFLYHLQQNQPIDIFKTLSQIFELFDRLQKRSGMHLLTIVTPLRHLLQNANCLAILQEPLYLDAMTMQLLFSSNIINDSDNDSKESTISNPNTMTLLYNALHAMMTRTNRKPHELISLMHHFHAQKKEQNAVQLTHIDWTKLM